MGQRCQARRATHQAYALGEIAQCALGPDDPGEPGNGRAHACDAAFEQAYFEMAFELADGLGQRGLRETHLLGCRAHAAGSGNDAKRVKVTKIQGINFVHTQSIVFTYKRTVKRIRQYGYFRADSALETRRCKEAVRRSIPKSKVGATPFLRSAASKSSVLRQLSIYSTLRRNRNTLNAHLNATNESPPL